MNKFRSLGLIDGENYRESGITDRRGPARLNRSSRLSPKDVTGR